MDKEMANHDELMHYGTPRHSGRYPWGSGDNPFQHETGFLATVNDYKKQGLSEKEIAEAMGMTINQLRFRKSNAKAEQWAADSAEALRLKDKGYSNVEIGRIMGKNESTIRNLIDPTLRERREISANVATVLKDSVDSKGYIDIGPGTENLLGVSRTKLKTATQALIDEGYKVHYVKVENVALPGKYTTVQILSTPDKTYSDVYKNRDQIRLVTDYHSNDGGRTFLGLETPTSLDSNRVYIRYREDGGLERDGTIELRRGVEDISLGDSKYAQVRVAVDGTHYLKGMALYSDDIPDGYDIVFNTNKKSGTPKEKVFKPLKDDPDNPFGSLIKMEDGEIVGQRHYIDKDGKDRLSPINIVREEGDWEKWSKTLSSQMLSKQYPALAKKQLTKAYDESYDEFKEIVSLTNPEIKVKLLNEFADSCDSDAVHLKAAALPRQSTKVILPLPGIKENEVFAPTYKDGEQVVLIRYPHGGTFEIPTLTVNNRLKTGKDIIGLDSIDAIGIHPVAAERLSGADFDGDTVIVIPTVGQKIKTSSPLKGLENFDPKESYPAYEGMPEMKSRTKQTEMGKVSNLITDMTIKGAPEDEIARAVRHSMVVIDAEKHHLNYKQSYIDNGIADLKKRYQGRYEDGKYKEGASTLISRASSEIAVPVRKELSPDPETGEKRYEYTGETYIKRSVRKKTGEVIEKELPRTQSSTQMYEVPDARLLSSGTKVEEIYADYANKMKALGNEARKEALATPSSKASPSARTVYADEVSSLKSKLNTALQNKPYERQAQIIANSIIANKKADNPDLDKEDLKKIRTQALNEARNRTGANKTAVQVVIEDREWEAIQAGAVSSTMMKQILDNTDTDRVRQLATPRTTQEISPTRQNKIKALLESGKTLNEVAEAVGVSPSTVAKYA